MRQHARERDRAESRIAELEQRKRILEAAMGAVENCWNQVRRIFDARLEVRCQYNLVSIVKILDQLQTVLKTDSLPIPGPSNIKGVSISTRYV
jgi:hypothetical protein